MDSTMIFCEMEDMLLLPLYPMTIGYWEHQGRCPGLRASRIISCTRSLAARVK